MSIKKLRSITGMPIIMCSNAWKIAEGHWDKAIEILHQNGLDKSLSLEDRQTASCFVGTYVHHDGKRAGVVQLSCEADFVSNTPEFRRMANDLAMHVCVADNLDKLEEQFFIFGEKETIGTMIKTFSAKTGEKIVLESTFKI